MQPPDFLQLAGKPILIFGVANRKSVAYHIGRVLTEAGAECLYVVQNEAVRQGVARLLGDREIYLCDVEHEEQIARLQRRARRPADGAPRPGTLDCRGRLLRGRETLPRNAQEGLFAGDGHLLLFAAGREPHAWRTLLDPDASVVTISISTTRMASESYGYMAPIKAALDSSLAFLAKSFSRFSRVRFNAVAPGLLKTSASAGIPGYVDSYLYAEQVIPRKRAVATEEVANAGGLPAQSAIQRRQRPADRGRRRHVDQLFRPRSDPPRRYGPTTPTRGSDGTYPRSQTAASLAQ